MNFINNDNIELIIKKINNNTKKSVITLINLSLTSKIFYELTKSLINNIVIKGSSIKQKLIDSGCMINYNLTTYINNLYKNKLLGTDYNTLGLPINPDSQFICKPGKQKVLNICKRNYKTQHSYFFTEINPKSVIAYIYYNSSSEPYSGQPPEFIITSYRFSNNYLDFISDYY